MTTMTHESHSKFILQSQLEMTFARMRESPFAKTTPNSSKTPLHLTSQPFHQRIHMQHICNNLKKRTGLIGGRTNNKGSTSVAMSMTIS
jgi:hypothetical protein